MLITIHIEIYVTPKYFTLFKYFLKQVLYMCVFFCVFAFALIISIFLFRS